MSRQLIVINNNNHGVGNPARIGNRKPGQQKLTKRKVEAAEAAVAVAAAAAMATAPVPTVVDKQQQQQQQQQQLSSNEFS